MCGIYGLVSSRKINDTEYEDISSNVKNKLKERGPDNFCFERINQNIVLSHSRLAIHDVSDKGNQPFGIGEQKIIFNGEIYNFRMLKKEIIKIYPDVIFESDSDTEVLFYMIRLFGIKEALKKIKGMFAFCYLDISLGELYLATDSFSQKPLYFKDDEMGFEFGSFPFFELKDNKKSLCETSVLEYFRTGCYPSSNKTIFKSHNRLTQGSLLTYKINKKEISIDKYTSEVNKKKLNDYSNVSENWQNIFENLIDEYIDSDVPISVLVSGGIDSSCLMLALSRLNKNVLCITIDTGDSLSEVNDAKKIANYLGLEHKTVKLENFTDRVMSSIANNMPQPVADPAIIPLALIANTMSNQGIKVGLVGDGGDELFNGYQSHYINSQNSGLPKLINSSNLLKILKLFPKMYRESIAYRLFGFLKWEYKHPYTYHCARSMGLITKPDYLKIGNQYLWPSLLKKVNFKSGLQESEYIYRIPNRFAPKIDISGMSSSIEYRVPFLDSRLVDYTFSMNLNVRSTQLNYLKKYLPESMIAKNKKGLGLNLSSMLNNELNNWVENIFEKINIGFYDDLEYLIDFRKLKNMYDKNKKYSRYSKELYQAYVFLTWWEYNQ